MGYSEPQCSAEAKVEKLPAQTPLMRRVIAELSPDPEAWYYPLEETFHAFCYSLIIILHPEIWPQSAWCSC